MQFTRACPDGQDPVARVRALRLRLERARESQSPVLATPSTLKSLLLHYIEQQAALHDALPRVETDDAMRDAANGLRKEAAICDELRACLRMLRGGLLIMDEADVIFHPLKSELNFPVGQLTRLADADARMRATFHLLRAVLDGACEATRAAIAAAVAAREMSTKPHLLLVDRESYATRLLPPLAEWMWRWLQAELTRVDASLLTREPLEPCAGSCLDAEHAAACGVGGETTIGQVRGGGEGAGFKGVGFWCSKRDPGEDWWMARVQPPAVVRTVTVEFKFTSNFVGNAGKTMCPTETVVELSFDGGASFPFTSHGGQSWSMCVAA